MNSYQDKSASYSWVKRGDTIAQYTVRRPKTSVPILKWFFDDFVYSTPIVSPASGLVIHSIFQENKAVELGDEPPLAHFAILLPDDEPAPLSGREIFGGAVKLLSDHMDLLMKPSRFWTLEPMDREVIEELFEKQLSANCRTYPALPHWQNYFDEARTEYPALRPYLKHLR